MVVDVILQEQIITRRRNVASGAVTTSSSLWPSSIEYGGLTPASAIAEVLLWQDSRTAQARAVFFLCAIFVFCFSLMGCE